MDRSQLKIPADAPVAFVDVETTGANPARDRIIEIAVVGARGGELEFEWSTLVNPGAQVPGAIQALTGIYDEMLEDAPPFARVADELRKRLAGRVFIAHNARFDYGFVRREFARAGSDWDSTSLCTVKLSRALYPDMPRHNLDAVIEFHGLEVSSRHRAMPDAQALWQFWRTLRANWSCEDLEPALAASARDPSVAPGLPEQLYEELPEDPGVYRLFGDDDSGADVLLYIGKAANLRERVLDHFRGADAKSRRLAAKTKRVTFTQTAGELGALLLEAREIRERQPVYNKQLRGGAVRHTWWFEHDDAAPRLVSLDAAVLRTGNAFGTWRMEREARHALEELARVHHWCFKLLGLEEGPGSCVGLQVGRCSGACVGAEPVALHLARVKVGLMRLQLPPWPHAGPVVVREGYGEHQSFHVVDAWQHLATFDGEEAAEGLQEFARGRGRRIREFDVDGYRILKRMLRNRRVTPLPPPPPEFQTEDAWT